ncbi:biopolymer transporter ExbD [Treponema sp.]|uniref:ExbD/TolR family protein n=1 Tax=Treponema sp. TaxID=166 RepID=UPI0025F8D60E|nr:biopolymer transporter ExbD [Treponema sp.]MCR5218325.1 biopolymer transporter ExbD [Treponema sp.]
MPDFIKKIMHEEELGINITSMIDVIFILLIFFMVSTQFKKAHINMELPQVEDTITVTEKNTTATLAVNASQIELEGKIITLDQLQGELELMLEANPELAITFSADKNISYERFLEVYVKIENAGITRIAIEHESLDK